ncbi:MAG: hypothetical protein JXR13_04195 [Thalassovita sp.]
MSAFSPVFCLEFWVLQVLVQIKCLRKHIEYVEVNGDDFSTFRSLYQQEGDLYFVDLLTSTCTRRNLRRRHRQLEFSPDIGVIRQQYLKAERCNLIAESGLSERAIYSQKVVGWTLSSKEDFCLVPAVNAAANLIGRCVVVGCRLNVNAGTRMTFVTPIRDIAAAVHSRVEMSSSTKSILEDPNTINRDYSTKITRQCPPERF